MLVLFEVNTTINELGGKGYALSRLIENGYNVPQAFIIPSCCFMKCLKLNNVYEKVIDICNKINQENFEKNSIVLKN